MACTQPGGGYEVMFENMENYGQPSRRQQAKPAPIHVFTLVSEKSDFFRLLFVVQLSLIMVSLSDWCVLSLLFAVGGQSRLIGLPCVKKQIIRLLNHKSLRPVGDQKVHSDSKEHLNSLVFSRSLFILSLCFIPSTVTLQ